MNDDITRKLKKVESQRNPDVSSVIVFAQFID